MYASFYNQFYNLSRFAFSFGVIFVILPKFIFLRDQGEDFLDRLISRYITMVFLCIVVGYFLVMIKLYEVMSFVFVMLCIFLYNNFIKVKRQSRLKDIWHSRSLWLYDELEGRISVTRTVIDWLFHRTAQLKRTKFEWPYSFINVGNIVLLMAVLLYSGYLRFYDAILHAAPAMSDAYVTLSWTKYIEERLLFHDAIYPQGFHIYLSILHKFAATDPLYILKYAGPFNTVLTIVGLYFVVSRLTGQKSAGIITAFIFGVLPGLLPLEYSRQASTNSQEFALIFLLPGLYYADRYLRYARKEDLITAFCSIAVIGLVHTIVLVFLAIGLICLAVVHVLINFRESIKRVGYLFVAGVYAVILSGIPVIIGLILGKKFHGSSVEFLSRDGHAPFPPITLVDKVTLGGLALFLFVALVIPRLKVQRSNAVFAMLFGVSSFFMYILLGPLTGKEVLITRMGILWGVITPVLLGFAWFSLCQLLPGEKLKAGLIFVFTLVFIAIMSFYYRSGPVVPYKMEYDSTIEQYLDISKNFRPTDWMIVSPEENYAVILGKGFHLSYRDFLDWYNPTDKILNREVNGKRELLQTPDIFIFYEKEMFMVKAASIEPIMRPIYQKRAQDYVRLAQWLKAYSAAHKNINLYYEDKNIQVFRIHIEKTRTQLFQDIWGDTNSIN